ncbi:hypothetical protein BN126380106 [Stenotrophomonas maltophilia]|nr:hypothetical protein BN126380106 [Stenotrophomonas maltophilia]
MPVRRLVQKPARLWITAILSQYNTMRHARGLRIILTLADHYQELRCHAQSSGIRFSRLRCPEPEHFTGTLAYRRGNPPR